ncbi:hypothetical protein KKE19_01870 [Patescibacteria group bacterium]|nr:hypothetical protein [Patescibacteria group bacterium]MBU4274540.1 hypothetical protein [Patescibacteria group bacterium]MBU4367445.1 hypothetical protein [Patescibacteria group bacterium]MBU4461765.1 hypothetical protein [Patescibacteria group bacterium]MCG2700149.1 hypothetical protein [Candidatus Parcubacteria bacterium]
MDGKGRNFNLAEEVPSSDVSLLIQRINELQQEKEKVAKGKTSLFLLLRRVEENIHFFLEELNIDDELLSVTESEGLKGLVATLFVVIKSLQHDIECRNRDQKRLTAVVEAFQKRARDVKREQKILERENMELEINISALEGEIKKARKKRK